MICLGAPHHISVRPLIYGLMRGTHPRIRLVYDEPSALADALARGQLDAALIPSIEYLRGSGALHVDGPALVAKRDDGNVILVSQKPLGSITRVAVDEFCRTPVAVLRVVLADLHGITPDFPVEKNLAGWREGYDAVLLCGDAALHYRIKAAVEGDRVHNVAGMWYELTRMPLVAALWAYNDPAHASELHKSLTTSRNLGLQNLSHLADGIAQTSEYESAFLYDYLHSCWSYDMREEELLGLHELEERAMYYDLLRFSRLEGATTA